MQFTDLELIDPILKSIQKTAAFAIPTLQILSREADLENRNKAIKCLILTPTRELAIQIEENIQDYGDNLSLRHAVIFGGVKQNSQVAKLKRGVDILVATPGRLLDLMNQWYIDLKQIEILILDEADRMLDMWFINDVRKVLAIVPEKRQTLFPFLLRQKKYLKEYFLWKNQTKFLF